jgi:hypothetical protein
MEITPSSTADSHFEDQILGIAIFGIAGYSILCLCAYFWISLKVPLSTEDLAVASWLTPRLGLEFHARFFGYALLFFAAVQALFRSKTMAGIFALIGIFTITSTFESGVLRLGILQDQAKIGCFTYEALECRRMLAVSEEGAKSMLVENPGAEVRSERFAEWYRPIREQLMSDVTGQFPFLSLVQSPFLIGRTDELREKIELQRKEVAAFRASLAK